MDLLLPSVGTKIVGKELLLYKQTVEELCEMSKGNKSLCFFDHLILSTSQESIQV